MRTLLRPVLRPVKFALRRYLLGAAYASDFPPDIPAEDRTIISAVWPEYSMTSVERLYALIEAVRLLEHQQIPGAFVECGVWRGGSMMAAAKALLAHQGATRDLYLFDTFEGMPAPGPRDRDFAGRLASALMATAPVEEERGVRCLARLPDVQANLRSTGYPDSRMHWVQGRVEDTIPTQAPEQIALLRLDTDWYESTLHELVHLYPRLRPGGVLIIDDYGHWHGARQAVDEYFAHYAARPYLHRIDYGARLVVKPAV
jgi:O-methyltransferase